MKTEGATDSPEGVVGIVGIGLVGGVIADRLAAGGFAVAGFDPGEPRSRAPELCGAAGEVFRRCQTVFLSLPDSTVVGTVLDEVAPALAAGHLVVDTTTGDPEDAVANAAKVANAASGAAYIEATVAGSSHLLSQRRAGLFLGGDAGAIARARPLFDLLAEPDRVFHLGAVGAASRFKLVHNLVLGLHRAVLAEALHFGQALGFDPALTLEVLGASPAASLVMGTKGKKMVEASYDPPQARLSQHLKDVRLILAEAARAGARTPLSETHRELLERAEELGFGASDTAAVIEAYRRPGTER